MARYPEALLDWSGNRAGGVKKLFYSGSGRPAGIVVKTGLLDRLHRWSRGISSGDLRTPRIVLLVGGPGNGKTEAVEYTVRELDAAMQLGGALVDEVAENFSGNDGRPTPRRVEAKRIRFPEASRVTSVSIVQDASESEHGSTDSPAKLLCDDVRMFMHGQQGRVYIACVNRGVLDDALILSTDTGDSATSTLLKAVIQSVALSANSTACWPLEGFEDVAVWPMDVETLVDEMGDSESAAMQILHIATSEGDWPVQGECEAGPRCPFCLNRKMLAAEPHGPSLVRILRWYELASGKRWNFRDLFSLTAFLLAGTPDSTGTAAYRPCQWAASLLSPAGGDPKKIEIQRMRGLFKLVSAQYQHALFGVWPVEKAYGLRSDIAELKLGDVPVLTALQLFLGQDKRREATSTLRAQLTGLSDLLDPAFASPNVEVAVSAATKIRFDDLDRRFSLSIKEGRNFLQKYQCLSPLEIELLKALGEADDKLSEESVRRQKPAVAERVQGLLRLIACRIARRSVGARSGVTRDSEVLEEFQRVFHGNVETIQEATQQVERLLNQDRRFMVCLNTTFGEPMPPPERRAMLTTGEQRVRPMPPREGQDRPQSPVRFLRVGGLERSQPIALTYELFRATKALRKGMIPASLPRSVVALLDTTRARLAGSIVRDEESLDSGEIRLGIREEVVVRSFGRFVVRRGDL